MKHFKDMLDTIRLDILGHFDGVVVIKADLFKIDQYVNNQISKIISFQQDRLNAMQSELNQYIQNLREERDLIIDLINEELLMLSTLHTRCSDQGLINIKSQLEDQFSSLPEGADIDRFLEEQLQKIEDSKAKIENQVAQINDISSRIPVAPVDLEGQNQEYVPEFL